MALERRRAVPSRFQAEAVGLSIEDPLAQKAIERLRAIIDDPDSRIDSGGAAVVYRLSNGVCMKVLHERKEGLAYDAGNSIQEEARFNQLLTGFVKSGVRSPHYIGRIIAQSPKKMEAILMEELRAVNLQYILNGKAQMPQSFRLDPFLNALGSYVTELNERLGIAHGDLEPRNVMVDSTSGLPRVIDFGRASLLRNIDPVRKKKKIDGDWSNFEKIEEKLEAFQASSISKCNTPLI
jgi:serine/threonine protein kinase